MIIDITFELKLQKWSAEVQLNHEVMQMQNRVGVNLRAE